MFFMFEFDLNVKYRPSNKRHGLQKKFLYRNNRFFSVDHVKINELHAVASYAILVDKITGVMISIKKGQ